LHAIRNVAEVLRGEWLQPVYRPDLLAIGTVTDAWQPIGCGLRLTRGLRARNTGGDAWPS
jgi:DNA repair photolyase